ncbi:MAG TPA: hypothetical protein VM487_14670, partial [Phycisphaerae bacterium]|nr:hypothetical protein [Phycisphaerae bacterium]
MPVVYSGGGEQNRVFDLGPFFKGVHRKRAEDKEDETQANLRKFFDAVDGQQPDGGGGEAQPAGPEMDPNMQGPPAPGFSGIPSNEPMQGPLLDFGFGPGFSGIPSNEPMQGPPRPNHGYDELGHYWREGDAEREDEAQMRNILLAAGKVDQRLRPELMAYAGNQMADQQLGRVTVRRMQQTREAIDQGDFAWGGGERKLAESSAREQSTRDFLEEKLQEFEESPPDAEQLAAFSQFVAQEKRAALDSRTMWDQIDYTVTQIDGEIAEQSKLKVPNNTAIMEAIRIKGEMNSRNMPPGAALSAARDALSGNTDRKAAEAAHRSSVYRRLDSGIISREQADAELMRGPVGYGSQGGGASSASFGTPSPYPPGGGGSTADTAPPDEIDTNKKSLLDEGADAAEGAPEPLGVGGIIARDAYNVGEAVSKAYGSGLLESAQFAGEFYHEQATGIARSVFGDAPEDIS